MVGVGSVNRKGVVWASESVFAVRSEREERRWWSMLRQWWKGSGEGRQQREDEEEGRVGRAVGMKNRVMVVIRM